MKEAVLQYPFADGISPHAAALEALTVRWLRDHYPMLPEAVKERYAATRTGYLTARFFPLASYQRLIPLAMSSLWGLAFDDYYEHASPVQFEILQKEIGAIIRGELACAGQDSFNGQMQVMAEGFRRFMPAFWMERFARSMEIYIGGMAAEAPYKAALQFPTLDTYMAIRWRSVDVLQMIDGLEVATGMPLPDEVRHHPHLERMAWLTCRMIAWCNDFFSADKEQNRDVMNLVLLLAHEGQCGFAAAQAEAIRIHDQDLEQYLLLEQELPDFGPYNTAVKKFLEYNKLMIAGHRRWYITDTLRYRPGGSPEPETFKGMAGEP